MTSRRLHWLTGWRPLVLLSLLWAVLYLPNLRTNPGWYGDETLIHHTSRNLASGIASNFALWNTFWHPHYPYQPAYSLVNGLFAKVAGGDIVGSRLFNTFLALAIGLAIYGIGRRQFGSMSTIFAASMFLTYSQSIIHFRMSYAHNAVGLGLLLMTLFLLKPSRPSSEWKAGLGLMLAAGAHPLFVHGAITGALCRWRHPRAWVRLALPSAVCLSISLALIYSFFGNWLFEDLDHLKNVFTARGNQDGGGLRGLQNFWQFITQDWFHIGLLAGLLFCIPLRQFAVPFVGLAVLFLLVRNRQNLILFYYQAIVVLPILCLGWAGLWRYLDLSLRKYLPRMRWIVCFLAFLPLFLLAENLPDVLLGQLKPRNHYWVTQSTREVEDAAKWLNERTRTGDVVGGNPNIAWLLNAETVPYLQMITWYGIPTQGYENGNKIERFRFDASLENCKYAVIGDIDQHWTFHEPNVGQLLQRMEQARWPIVWQGKHYLILANPDLQNLN